MQESATRVDVLELYASERGAIELYLYAACRDYHLVQDILQEVALALVKNGPQYDESRPFGPWVRGIARKQLLYRMRGRSSAGAFVDPKALESVAQAFGEYAARDDEQIVSRHLAECVASLGRKARKLIHLKYERGRNCAGIADEFGRTVQAVYSMLKRTKRALRECVQKRLGSHPYQEELS